MSNKNILTYNKTIIIFLMVIAMFTWGIAWTSAKVSNEYLNNHNLVFLRFFVGFITMCPLLYNRHINFSNISYYTYLNILIVSILFFLYNQCFFLGTGIGKPGFGGVFVTTTNPIITFIIASVIFKEINIFKILSISLGVLGGLLTLNFHNLGIESLLSINNKYFIFCSLIWGVMTIIMSNGQKKIDSIYYITFCYAITTFISILFIDIHEILNINNYDIRFFINFFFVCSAMSFGTSIYIIGSYVLGPISASSFIFSVPFISMGTAYLFLNENIDFNVIIGGILSLISIFLINYISIKN